MTPTQSPFPHMIIDGFWQPSVLQSVIDEFPTKDDLRWKRYKSATENKLEGPPTVWGSVTLAIFEEMQKLAEPIARAFGTPKLHMESIGGGYHFIEPGGYLKMHTDFNRSPRTGRYRRINLLVYLNRDWRDQDGGHLELWDNESPQVKIAPEFNRTVIFETSDHSWHGHPVPTLRERRSIATYFFTDEPPPDYKGQHSTIWHPLAKSG